MDHGRSRTTPLVVVAAVIEMLLGLAIYAFPDEFRSPTYAPLRPFFPIVSAALVAGGVTLLLLARYRVRPWIRYTLFPLPVIPLVVLTHLFAGAAVWTGVVIYGILGAALLVLPWLSATKPGETSGARPDLAEITLACMEGTIGALMLLAPHVFAGPSYMPISGVLPLAGTAGLAGTIALLLPTGGSGWFSLPGPVRRLAGAILPLLLAFNFMHTGIWTGVLAWGAWGVALLAGDSILDLAERAGSPQSESPQGDAIRVMERTLEAWTWLLALAVVVLTALGGAGAVASPITGNLFVLAITAFNASLHWGLPQVGTPARRVFWHLAFLTVALGFLLAGAGPIGHGFLALLVAAPALATRALGPAAGRQMLALALTAVFAAKLDGWLLAGKPANQVMGEGLLEGLVLAAAAAVGMRSAGDQRRLLQELSVANAGLQRQLEIQGLVDQIGNDIRRSLDLDEILRTTVNHLGRTLGVSRCFIRLRMAGDIFLLAEEFTASGVAPIGIGHVGHQMFLPLPGTEHRTVVIADVATDPRLESHGPGLHPVLLSLGAQAALLAPILVDGELLGLIGVHQCDRPRDWSKDEIRFLEAVSSQVGVAMASARTHQALAERHVVLQQAHQDLQAANEELLAQHEELQAQNEELRLQGEIIQAQRVSLEEALEAARKAEQARERLVAIVEATPDFVASASVDGHVQYYNAAARKMLGIGADEAISSVTIPDTHPEWAKAIVLNEGIPIAIENGVWSGETAFLSRDGGEIPVSQVIIAHKRPDGAVDFLSTIARDISERKRSEEQLIYLANRDPLTGLFNRRRFQEEVEEQLSEARRHGMQGALLFLDLDGFKYVNDSIGHQAGDELLRSVGGLLQRRLRATDFVARLGGDEFGILLLHTGSEQARVVAQNLLVALRTHTIVFNGQEVGVTASIGIALFPQHGSTADELLAGADLAMYRAKESGRDGFHVHTLAQSEHAMIVGKLAWEKRIRDALEQDLFVLHFQPILDLRSNQISQYEILLRMMGDDGELVPPATFLGIAEQFGLIRAIDRFVVRQAIRIMSEYKQAGRLLSLEVNLSGKSFTDGELLPMIQRELTRTGIDPARLVLEITETAAIADLNQARTFIYTLKDLGCKFAIDDFGTGFSTFYYLKHLPVDYLKIDGSFIQNLPDDPGDQHLVKAMVEVARGLGKLTIAEFVEDGRTVQLLKQYGVDFAQGYHIGKPGTLTEGL